MSKDEKATDINLNVETREVNDADNELLAELGYRAEFKREFSMLETIAFAISIMGVVASVTSTFSFPLVSGGHVGMVWGWFIPCIFVMAVALSMAELVSSMPTSAGLYYFSAKLAPPKYAALASWITGWANITGQVTLVCSIDFTCAQMITSAITVGSNGAIVLSSGATYGILLAILFCHGLVCSAATNVLARLNLFYVVVNGGTTVAAIVALLVSSGNDKVSTKDAFTLFENNTGWANNGWAFLLAFTAPMWTLTGYDSAAHISEEVAGAQRSAPIAIIAWSGYHRNIRMVTTYRSILCDKIRFFTSHHEPASANGPTLPRRTWEARHVGNLEFHHRCAGAAQGVDASRVIFAFARDNALPGSRWWKQVNRHTQTPVNASYHQHMYVIDVLSLTLGHLLSACTVSYATPIFLRITSGRNALSPGFFTLGRWYLPVGIVAVSWVAFIVVLLLFPPSQMTSAQGMNYAVVIIMGVFIFASISWVVSAHKWFHGPIKNIDTSRAASFDSKRL
ncbi:amino acid permease-domain-containing protein [Boletus reticuloceps]|uniref:Amino acid permease-domain-containing protein n=1 Tax=Boletus reticuloceps TaxID=495285 RepID=A0A8I2Z3G9_9AGAM|nr:amino acid permease-domain-containing protein [Boletus reticuloceps]